MVTLNRINQSRQRRRRKPAWTKEYDEVVNLIGQQPGKTYVASPPELEMILARTSAGGPAKVGLVSLHSLIDPADRSESVNQVVRRMTGMRCGCSCLGYHSVSSRGSPHEISADAKRCGQ